MQQAEVFKPLLSPSSRINLNYTHISRSNYGAAETNELHKLFLNIASQPDLFLKSFIEDIVIDHLEKKSRDPDTTKAIIDLNRLKNQIVPVNSNAERFLNGTTAEDIDSSINNFNICTSAINIALDLNIFAEDVGITKNDTDEQLHKQIIRQITTLQKDLHQTLKEEPSTYGCCGVSIAIGTGVLFALGIIFNASSSIVYLMMPSTQCFHCVTETDCTRPSRTFNNITPTFDSTLAQITLYYTQIITQLSSLLIARAISKLWHNKLTLTDEIKQLTIKKLVENKQTLAKRMLAKAVLNRALMGIIAASMTAYLIYRACVKVHYLPSQFNNFINCSQSITYPPLTCNSATTPCTVNMGAATDRYIGQVGDSYLIFGLGTLSAIYTIYAALVFVKYLINKINQLYHSCFNATKPADSAQIVRRVGIFAIADDLEGRQTRAESINADPNAIKMVELPTRPVPQISLHEIADMNRKCSTYSSNRT